MRTGCLLAALLALPAVASDFGARYPVGSIQDVARAQAALKDADAELNSIDRAAKSRDAECLRGLLVNSCRDDVRREKELSEREVRRVRVEARDLQRRIDAEESAKRRADQAAARELKDSKRPKPASAAIAAAGADRIEARDESAASKESAVPGSKGLQQPAERAAAHPAPPKLSAAERASNAQKFQQKQLRAQQRAQEQELERIERETRRAEKRKQTDRREAEREALRKRAAESIR